MDIHFIQTSQSKDNALQLCLRYINDNDLIILAGSALHCLQKGFPVDTWKFGNDIDFRKLNIKVLAEDAKSIAVSIRSFPFEQISYAEFIELSLTYKKVISW
ncbi:MAG: DsrH/TusB family sulfur metabolism protein [Parashewanella sp.]